MVNIVNNGQDDPTSNPGWGYLYFYEMLIPLEKVLI